MIIFDLDMTLVDTSIAEFARRKRDWKEVYNLIPKMQAYKEMILLACFFHDKSEKIAIVTNSPSLYAQKVLKYFEIPHNCLIGYHDVRNKKPSTEPYIKAKNILTATYDKHFLVFGDKKEDLIPATKLGFTSCACAWSNTDSERTDLLSVKYDFFFEHPFQVYDYFTKHHS